MTKRNRLVIFYICRLGDNIGRWQFIKVFRPFFIRKMRKNLKYFPKIFAVLEKSVTFASQLRVAALRAFSSAGLEHLPYKQRVGGSNPSTPTEGK